MNKNQVKKVKKQKKRERKLASKRDKGFQDDITKEDRKFGKLQLIILLVFVVVLLGFVISKIQ